MTAGGSSCCWCDERTLTVDDVSATAGLPAHEDERHQGRVLARKDDQCGQVQDALAVVPVETKCAVAVVEAACPPGNTLSMVYKGQWDFWLAFNLDP